MDTAEVYATPMDPSHCGKTEEYIGRWLQKRGCRDEFIIATKVGSSDYVDTARVEFNVCLCIIHVPTATRTIETRSYRHSKSCNSLTYLALL